MNSLIDLLSVRRMLQQRVTAGEADLVIESLPESAIGVVLYGSRARGDGGPMSDVDILVVADNYARSGSNGNVNTSTYDLERFQDADGSLFRYHLKRDAVVLHDTETFIAKTLEATVDPDPEKVIAKLRRLALILRSNPDDIRSHVSGVTRLARYLLRTALYAEALAAGSPSFSVRELSVRNNEPRLITLLSSHTDEQLPPNFALLTEIAARLEIIIGGISPNPHGTIEALIVNEWESDLDLANSALAALGRKTSDPYTEIPRIIV